MQQEGGDTLSPVIALACHSLRLSPRQGLSSAGTMQGMSRANTPGKLGQKRGLAVDFPAHRTKPRGMASRLPQMHPRSTVVALLSGLMGLQAQLCPRVDVWMKPLNPQPKGGYIYISKCKARKM